MEDHPGTSPSNLMSFEYLKKIFSSREPCFLQLQLMKINVVVYDNKVRKSFDVKQKIKVDIASGVATASTFLQLWSKRGHY